MINAATAVFFLLSIVVSTSVAEDWKKIARDTDEPAFGQQVIHVCGMSVYPESFQVWELNPEK